MSDNPYESPTQTGRIDDDRPKTESTRWLIWLGVTSLLASAACLVVTVVRMIAVFQRIAASSTAPKPSDLANEISVIIISDYCILPLAILGIGLIVAGLLIRRPAR